MFDNLREDASSFYDEEEGQTDVQQAEPSFSAGAPVYTRPSRFLGMTSIQRFIIAIMLLFTVCILGALCLLATGRIGVL
jgi:hypothetical protein